MASALPPGIQFPRDAQGRQSSARTGKAIFAAALALADRDAARALRDEADWRRRYPQHLVALTRAGAGNGGLAVAMARTTSASTSSRPRPPTR